MASWIPDNEKPRALMIAIHGLGSHGLDLTTIGEFMAEKGIAVYAPDMRGFGHFEGQKGHVMRFNEYVEDIQNLVMQVKDQFLNKLTYLFGASLGGLMVLRYVMAYPRTVDGILLQCPAVAQSLDINPVKRVFARFLSLLNVKMYFEGDVNLADGSRNQKAIKRHETDPLRFEGVTARLGTEALKASEQTFKEGNRIVLPVFYQQAGEDKLISPIRSKQFYESIASKDKTFRMYDGLYHELHEEPEKDMVLGDMYGWLQKRLPS